VETKISKSMEDCAKEEEVYKSKIWEQNRTFQVPRAPNVPVPRKLTPILCVCCVVCRVCRVRRVSCVSCASCASCVSCVVCCCTQGNLNSFKELDARISGVGNIAVRIGTSVCGDVDTSSFSAAQLLLMLHGAGDRLEAVEKQRTAASEAKGMPSPC
jgi:hypothetical protein